MQSRLRTIALPVLAFVLGVALTSWLRSEETSHSEHGEEAEAPTGPHGGRVVEDDDLALEVVVFERGVPPELRVYPTRDGEPLDPARVTLEATLRRLGGRADRVAFAPREDHLVGDRTIDGPHSFDVELVARVGEREHRFAYAAHAGRVMLDETMAEASGIGVETAGPARIVSTVPLHGHVVPNAERTVHVTPRFPGMVREMRKRLGDKVAAGEVVAVLESDESLRPYELRSGAGGTVIARGANPGEHAAGDAEVYRISDLATVWIDLHAHRSDAPKLATKQALRIVPSTGGEPIAGEIEHVAPVASESSQTLLARAVVANPDGRLQPGFFVTAEATVEAWDVPVAVRTAALHDLGDGDVVFVREGDAFEATPVEIGRRDASFAEVVEGLAAGTRYAVQNSFVLKSDVRKAGAGHDH
jgi:cobalt-zinc-cadmium efflux system membrane fusion protein